MLLPVVWPLALCITHLRVHTCMRPARPPTGALTPRRYLFTKHYMPRERSELYIIIIKHV